MLPTIEPCILRVERRLGLALAALKVLFRIGSSSKILILGSSSSSDLCERFSQSTLTEARDYLRSMLVEGCLLFCDSKVSILDMSYLRSSLF